MYAQSAVWKRVPFVALLALVLAFPATGGVGESVAAKKRVRLKAFTSCSALVKYARGHATRVYGPAGPRRDEGPPATGGPLPEAAVPAPTGGSVEDTSGTNVQEVGVDEPDIVKTDGSRIFAVDDNRLNAVDARSEEPRLLDSLVLDSYGAQLLLDGDRLLVISGGGAYYGDVIAATTIAPGYYRPETKLTEVDVSDPRRMKVTREQTIEGSVVSSRLNGRSARIVILSPPEAIAQGGAEARSTVRGWVPTSTYVNKRTGRKRVRSLAPCRTVRTPTVFAGLDMLSVVTVDMARGLPSVDVDSVMAGGDLVYASEESLYVATQRWFDGSAAPGTEPPRTTTAIHRFDISDPRVTRYRSSGVVTGYLLNQFSMSERKGVLRVASTDSPSWWGGRQPEESQSYVTTLEERGGRLEQAGRVGGLGKGERIYAVRFFDDVGFVVTFRQVDPLYSLDLSDPANPRVVGELKIEGYSAYLHPVGDDLLLGIGQDATREGRRLGTQLSLFDVSDLAKPVRIQRATLGSDSGSDVEYDHHAFLYWAPEKLAVIPVYMYEGEMSAPFQGAIGFHVERTGIDEAGRTEHRDSGGYASPVMRSLVVRGRLFTVSGSGVQLNDLGTLKEQASVQFPAPAPPPAPPGPEPAPAPPSR